MIVQINQIAQRLGAEFDPVVHASSSLTDPHAGHESWQILDLLEAHVRGPTASHRKHQSLPPEATSLPRRHVPAKPAIQHESLHCQTHKSLKQQEYRYNQLARWAD
jgi:hypothetical protein